MTLANSLCFTVPDSPGIVVATASFEILAQDPTLGRVLAEDERRKASEFVFSEDQQRSALGRAFLRRVLAAHILTLETKNSAEAVLEAATPQRLDEVASQLIFDRAPGGKLILPTVAAPTFSYARSRTGVAVVVSSTDRCGRRLSVGIDLEDGDARALRTGLVHAAYSRSEKDLLRDFGSHGRDTAVQMWTVKEAVAKAQGVGLSAPFPEIETAFENGDLRLIRVPPAFAEIDVWGLYSRRIDGRALAVAWSLSANAGVCAN